VLVLLKDQLYALDAGLVYEIVRTPDIVQMPEAPVYVRGVINLRGNVIPLVDLRQLIGLDSAAVELANLRATLRQRQQDHRNWIHELEACIRERREFKLATDPTKCAFGRWYGSYQSADISVGALLRRFDAPHRAIHATAHKALALLEEGHPEEALAVVEQARGTVLASLLPCFDELDALLVDTNREVSVVLGSGGKRVAVTVDAVESVERFADGSVSSLDESLMGLDESCMVQSIGRRAGNNGLVTILDVECLLRTTSDIRYAA
jgi:purine-binding chemotaxis protein CheW